MKRLDKETDKLFTEGEKLKLLVESEGWVIAKKVLFDMIVNLESILNVDIKEKSPEDVLREIGIKQTTIDLVIKWIQEIEGKVNQHINNHDLISEHRKDEFVKYYEG